MTTSLTNLFKKPQKSFFLITIVILLVLFFILFKTDKVENTDITKKITETKNSKTNQYIQIDNLNLKEDPLKIYGKTTSKSQVDVYAQIPDKVSKINVSLGDYVNAGDLIISLESSFEVNNLNQANFNLNTMELRLAQTLSGTQKEDIKIATTDLQIKKKSFEKIKDDIKKDVSNLKIFLESTLRKDIDDFFSHTDISKSTYHPTFIYRLKSEKIIKELEVLRVNLDLSFSNFIKNEPQYSIEEKIERSIKITSDFLKLSEALYINSKDFLGSKNYEKEKTENIILAIKNKIDTKEETLKNLKLNLDNSKSYLLISENTLNKLKNGPRPEAIKISESNVKTAKNSVNLAKISLSKKILRAPISGKISFISADVGKLALSTTPLFSIHNTLNLKIESSISDKNLQYINIGKNILVGGYKAKITAISPVLNSNSGSINFEAEFTEKISSLISGQFLEIIIDKDIIENKSVDKIISIPLSSVFEFKEKYFVFILNENLRAEKTPVEFIKIFGKNILIKNTFNGSEKLIINARGISHGDEM